MNSAVRIQDIMSTEVISIHYDDDINIVNKTFEKFNFHHIPIVDANQKVVGIISKIDLLRLTSIRDQFTEKEFNLLKVSDFMTGNVITLHPEDSVLRAAQVFLTNQIHALPIVENEQLKGIVTSHDLIRFAFSAN